VTTAAARGIDVAIDLAFQASPDHPWVKEHPAWFRHLPDGSIRHAENPPKRYEDIYPLNFETDDWRALWTELLDVVRFWIAQGVKVFRVDNPHTKPFAFWEWMIGLVRADHPEVIFLSEAFTRPTVMQQLAKVGFTQSYTYFTWRNSKWEIETYLTELTKTDVAEYFRPNFWPNTPDILHESLQTGGRAAFLSRLVLAATLGASYGIYGPVFELQEHIPRSSGSEEYSHSEKYEIRSWDLARPDSLSEFIARVNKIRRDHAALQFNDALHFTGSTTTRSSPIRRRGIFQREGPGPRAEM
jgi:starch synthase (maltosyl-transferring)